jgi:phosphate transport system protein
VGFDYSEQNHFSGGLLMVKHLNAYDRALLKIGDKLLKMSELVSKHLDQAMVSLTEQDAEKAKIVILADEEIDTAEESLEMEALEIISLQQPMDRDLRFLAAAMRIGRELERISDYACDIAELIIGLNQRVPYFKPLIDLSRMAGLVQAMLHKSLKSYSEKNITLAGQMDDDDNEVDQLFMALLEELTGFMKKGPEYVDQSSKLLLVTRYLERIGDHTVNIAEMVIFTETEERHPFKVKNQNLLCN